MIWTALWLLVPLTMWASPVNETEARQRAQAFLQARGKSLSEKPMQMPKSRRISVDEPYYVFNVGSDEGFVIVSGDDRTASILGYADNGSIDLTNLPDGLRYMLDGYAEEIAWLKENVSDESYENQARSEVRRSVARSAIAPLIATRWDQGAPYNLLCPEISDIRTVTGCVATSMAQVMYFHRYPQAVCSAIPGYGRNTKDKDKQTISLTVGGLEATTFDWASMTLTYGNKETGDAADAVAKLMKYCGVSLQMVYGLSSNGGSSAYNVSIAEALKNYFGYDGSVSYAQRTRYTYAEWISLIYSELAANRPVVLGGQSVGGGHSFVCDGYDIDDYFHINWGWGGDSDGFFRLSLLNPYEQGVGGSSTLDGFTYGQDAVIGIRPSAGTPATDRLSLELMQFDANGSASQLIVNRDNAADAFTGISVYYTVCNYSFTTSKYDYALQLTDADGNVVQTLHESLNQSCTFNVDKTNNLTELSTPAALADGTYYIKVVSRATDADDWQDCYDGTQQQMTAIVSDNTITITAPMVRGSASVPTSATFTINGDKIQGHDQEVIATITGGSLDYHGEIILSVNNQAVMGKTVDINAGQTVDVHFNFIPSETGENNLKVYDRKTSSTPIGTTTIAITESDASNTQEITVVPTIVNKSSDNKLYGNALRVTAHVTNTSSDKSYASTLNCSLRTYDNGTDKVDDFVNAEVKHQNINIAVAGSTDVTFEYTGLELGKFYCLRFTYTQSYEEDGQTKQRIQQALITDRYEMGEGYLTYNADGSNSIMPKKSTIDGGNSLCVDLTGITSISTVTLSTNPNCVYLMADDAVVPDELANCNVVKGNTASKLTLSDGSDFYTPVAFTANNVSYSRTFTHAAAGESGWYTLFLPFTATSVTCEGIGEVDWFRSDSDTGKNFWLREFSADADGSVNFDYAQVIAANTPYLIAVPGNDWGEEWNMTGKTVTFSGTNVSIATTKPSSGVSGNHYKFCGSTTTQNMSDVYLLNGAGSSFVKPKTSAASKAFRAWFSPVSISSLSRASLSIVNLAEATGIIDVRSKTEEGTNDIWYTLDGRSLSGTPTAPGIYLCKGKKIVIR